ncbi:MAG: DUF1385 domain-containing protein [Clostridiales bacterium]|jgi:uncharacterized protein YqhQ|nr:DUF1385 domain-containing protein [Clostridiales bacterium]
MKEKTQKRVCTIGGQAVMEGVMMKAPTGIAMAVRRADRTIVSEYSAHESKVKKGTFFSWPIVRGVVTFAESISTGMRTITRSAELYGEDITEDASKFEKWLSEKTGKSTDKIVIGMAVALAVVLAVGLFFMLPTFISGLLLKNFTGTTVWKTLVEGLVRLAIFFAYICAIGLMKDARRLFMYHGAEHKVIACYEAEEELTPENASRFSRLHPRCGTNYLFLVMAISILFFAAVGYNANFWMRLLSRLAFLPVVAGLGYEVLRFGAKSDNILSRIVRAPGMALQRVTTREPDRDMLDVAIAAFNMALHPPEGELKTVSTTCETSADTQAGGAAEADARPATGIGAGAP